MFENVDQLNDVITDNIRLRNEIEVLINLIIYSMIAVFLSIFINRFFNEKSADRI